MQVKINGRETQVADHLLLRDLIRERNLSLKNLIVEINGEIVAENREDLCLKSGDNIELVQMVFGG
jgi:thiamine biosynthesis protein ThiS